MKRRGTYRLTLTADQVRVILDALDLTGRIAMGQFREIVDAVDRRHAIERGQRRAAELALLAARQVLMPELSSEHAYRSVFSENCDDAARVGYDLIQVLRHRLAWDESPNGGMTVNFDEPRRTSVTQELASIERVASMRSRTKQREADE